MLTKDKTIVESDLFNENFKRERRKCQAIVRKRGGGGKFQQELFSNESQPPK